MSPSWVLVSIATIAAFVVLIIRGGRVRCTCKWAEFELETDHRKRPARKVTERRNEPKQIGFRDEDDQSPGRPTK